MTKKEISDLVYNTETPQIKAGETHRFNDIWIVVVDGRLFCRQYSFGTKSWYHAFLEDSNGYIKCRNTITKIEALIPNDLEEINPKVNEAYLDKYANKFTTYPDIAQKMTGIRYMEKTMELISTID